MRGRSAGMLLLSSSSWNGCPCAREFRAWPGVRGFHNLHLDALAELERNGLLEGDANRQDAGVGRAAGVFGTDSAGDEAVGDFLDNSLPGLAGVALGSDRDGASGFAARDVKRIDLGLDTQSPEVDDPEQGRAQVDGLAGVRGACDDHAVDRRPNARAGEFGLDPAVAGNGLGPTGLRGVPAGLETLPGLGHALLFLWQPIGTGLFLLDLRQLGVGLGHARYCLLGRGTDRVAAELDQQLPLADRRFLLDQDARDRARQFSADDYL